MAMASSQVWDSCDNAEKAGSMRVGKDAMVFTKNGTTCSVGFLSQTFLEAINATEVLVPMCTWNNVYLSTAVVTIRTGT